MAMITSYSGAIIPRLFADLNDLGDTYGACDHRDCLPTAFDGWPLEVGARVIVGDSEIECEGRVEVIGESANGYRYPVVRIDRATVRGL